MSAVGSLEVVASRRLAIIISTYGILIRGPEALAVLGSVSASRSVRFRRFYCIVWQTQHCNKELSTVVSAAELGCH